MGYKTGWNYRRKLTIPHAKALTTESNVPCDVYLKGTDFNFAAAEIDGIDIRFTQSDGLTLLDFERIHHGLGYYEEQCVVTAGHGGQGLVADDDYFYWGKSNGIGVDSTIYKVTHSGVDVTSFDGPAYAGSGCLYSDHDTLLFLSWGGGVFPLELWEITKGGTKLQEWSFSGVDYAYGGIVAYKGDDQIWLVTYDEDYNMKFRVVTLYNGGAYDLGSVWTFTTPDDLPPRSVEYKDGYIWLTYGNTADGVKLSVLSFEDDYTMDIVDTYVADISVIPRGLAWLDETLYFGDNANTIRVWDRIAYYRVKVPSVSHINDTEIYMYYGNDVATDVASPTDVYDGNFVSVHNLIEQGDGAADEFEDSTSNANHGQGGAGDGDKTPTRIQGSLFKAQQFDGDDDFIDLDDAPYDITGHITISAYIKSTDLDQNNSFISKTESSAYSLEVPTSGKKIRFVAHDGSYKYADADAAMDEDTWYHVVGVWDGSNLLLYIDGVLQADQPAFAGPITTNNYNLEIGRNPGAVPANWMAGEIAWTHVSDTDRSAGWIKLEYYSITNNLFTYGSEESGILEYKYLFGNVEMAEQNAKYMFGNPEMHAIVSEYLFGNVEMVEQGNKYLYGLVETVMGFAKYLYGSVTMVTRIPKSSYGRIYQRISSVQKEVT